MFTFILSWACFFGGVGKIDIAKRVVKFNSSLLISLECLYFVMQITFLQAIWSSENASRYVFHL